MNVLKKEKGAISTLVLFTIVMFIAILMGIYFSITTMEKTQSKSDARIKYIYGQDVERIDEIYNEIVDRYLNEVVNEIVNRQ